MIHTQRVLVACLFSLLLAASCGETPVSEKEVIAQKETTPVKEPTQAKPIARNPKWAEPIQKPGLPNLHKIVDGLYRGAQPEPAGFAELKKMGIKTIVNLRKLHDDFDEIEEGGLKKDDFNHVPIPMNAWNAEDEHTVQFLKAVTDKANGPVFFHCQHGADRTGTMAAVYRVVVEGWTKEDALKEMTEGGFNFHSVWENLIKYMETLDVEKIRKEAGITKDQ